MFVIANKAQHVERHELADYVPGWQRDVIDRK
jgi:hypothetical protein